MQSRLATDLRSAHIFPDSRDQTWSADEGRLLTPDSGLATPHLTMTIDPEVTFHLLLTRRASTSATASETRRENNANEQRKLNAGQTRQTGAKGAARVARVTAYRDARKGKREHRFARLCTRLGMCSLLHWILFAQADPAHRVRVSECVCRRATAEQQQPNKMSVGVCV